MNVTSTPTLVTLIRKGFVNASSLGSNLVVAAPSATAKIRVLGVVAVTTAANSISFLSNASAVSATFPLAANGGFTLPFTEHGWFETNAGEALNINLSAATATGVQVLYFVLP